MTRGFKEEREKETSCQRREQQEEDSLPPSSSFSPAEEAIERDEEDLRDSSLRHVLTQERILSLLVHAAESSPALRQGENSPSAFLCWVKGFFSRESSSSAFSEKEKRDARERKKKKKTNSSEGKNRQEGWGEESVDGEDARLFDKEENERRKSERKNLHGVHAATKILQLMERRREARTPQRRDEEDTARMSYREEKRIDLNEHRRRLRTMRDSREEMKRQEEDEEEEAEEDFLMKDFRALCVEYASRYPSSPSCSSVE